MSWLRSVYFKKKKLKNLQNIPRIRNFLWYICYLVIWGVLVILFFKKKKKLFFCSERIFSKNIAKIKDVHGDFISILHVKYIFSLFHFPKNHSQKKLNKVCFIKLKTGKVKLLTQRIKRYQQIIFLVFMFFMFLCFLYVFTNIYVFIYVKKWHITG